MDPRLANYIMPSFPGFGQQPEPAPQNAAQARTMSIFGLKVPQRAVYSALSGLGNGPVANEGFFGNFVRGLSGSVAGGLNYDQQMKSEDERRAMAEQKAINDEYHRRLEAAQTQESLGKANEANAKAGAGPEPTSQQRNYDALVKLGMDPQKAQAVAFGVDKTPSPLGLFLSDPKKFKEFKQASTVAIGGLQGGDLTPAAKDMLAKNFAMTGNMPAMGMGAAPTRVAIMNQAAAKYPQADIGANRAQYQSDTKSLAALQPAQSMASSFGEMADKNVKQLEGELTKIPNYGNQVFNVVGRGIATKMGDPHMAAFNTAREIVRNEYARLLSTLGQGSSVLPEGARKDMGDILDKAQTPEQIVAAIKILRQDAKNKVSAINNAIGAVQKRVRGFEAAGGNLYGSQNQDNSGGGVNWTMDENGNLVPSQ